MIGKQILHYKILEELGRGGTPTTRDAAASRCKVRQ